MRLSMQCKSMQYNTIQYNTIQYNTILFWSHTWTIPEQLPVFFFFFFFCIRIPLVMLSTSEGRSPLSSPGLGGSSTASPSAPPPCGHVGHRRVLRAGQCWRMCSGVWGPVPKGHWFHPCGKSSCQSTSWGSFFPAALAKLREIFPVTAQL